MLFLKFLFSLVAFFHWFALYVVFFMNSHKHAQCENDDERNEVSKNTSGAIKYGLVSFFVSEFFVLVIMGVWTFF